MLNRCSIIAEWILKRYLYILPAWHWSVHQAVIFDKMQARLWETCALVVATAWTRLWHLQRETFILENLRRKNGKRSKMGSVETWLEDIGSQLLVRDSWFLKFPSKLLSMSSTENLHTALPRIALRGVVNTP